MNLDYIYLFENAAIDPSVVKAANLLVKRILNLKNIYKIVEAETKIPWDVIACIHAMESSLSLDKHLHNGDPLSDRTVNVPRGRPKDGEPPFSWNESAVDALKDVVKPEIWNIGWKLYFLESYNGFGYHKCGINSPYLWAGTNWYQKGKFTSDGEFDAEAISKQIGCAVILKTLLTIV